MEKNYGISFGTILYSTDSDSISDLESYMSEKGLKEFTKDVKDYLKGQIQELIKFFILKENENRKPEDPQFILTTHFDIKDLINKFNDEFEFLVKGDNYDLDLAENFSEEWVLDEIYVSIEIEEI